MSLYNIEVFRPDFTFRSSFQVQEITYTYDYLDVTKSKISTSKIDVNKGDYLRIMQGMFEAVGIVSDISTKKEEVIIEHKPFHKYFDVNILIDMSKLDNKSLEEWIAEIILKLYGGNEDEAQNIVGLKVQVTSKTEGASLANYSSGINNLMDIIIAAFNEYGIVVKPILNPGEKKITLQIGKVKENRFVIESDLAEILGKEITIKEDASVVNKVTIYNQDNLEESATYYIDADDEITQSTEKQVVPVIFKDVLVKVSSSKTFDEVAYNKAKSTLKTSKHNNEIEISVLDSNEIVRPKERVIGQDALIISGNKEYKTILTGYKIEDHIITLIFGTIRMALTKQLKIYKRKIETM